MLKDIFKFRFGKGKLGYRYSDKNHEKMQTFFQIFFENIWGAHIQTHF